MTPNETDRSMKQSETGGVSLVASIPMNVSNTPFQDLVGDDAWLQGFWELMDATFQLTYGVMDTFASIIFSWPLVVLTVPVMIAFVLMLLRPVVWGSGNG